MADRKDEIGAKYTRWSRPDSAAAGPRTPIAIALDAKGRDGSLRPKTPRVVATGRGPVAEQILAIAQQRPQLAQAYPGLHQAVVALGPSPAAFSGGGQIAVTALALRQTVTIDPTAMGGSAPLVR